MTVLTEVQTANEFTERLFEHKVDVCSVHCAGVGGKLVSDVKRCMITEVGGTRQQLIEEDKMGLC